VAKKLVPNPEYENARYRVDYIWFGEPPKITLPDIRTNNPRYLVDGSVADQIPSHIEVDE
jgi:hypothetical protein